MGEQKFVLSRQMKKPDEETWVRYDGYDGRYSVCITNYNSGYRYIQIFTYHENHPLAPSMYIVEDDITPVDIKLELCHDAKRYSLCGSNGREFWEKVVSEMNLAFEAAQEVKERFIDNKEDLSENFPSDDSQET